MKTFPVPKLLTLYNKLMAYIQTVGFDDHLLSETRSLRVNYWIYIYIILLATFHTFWNQQLVFCHRPTAIKRCWHVLDHWMLKLPTLLTTLNTPVQLLNPAINISQFDSVVRNGHIGLLAALFRLNRHLTHARRFIIDIVAALMWIIFYCDILSAWKYRLFFKKL